MKNILKMAVALTLVFAMSLPVGAQNVREFTQNARSSATTRINGFDFEAWTDHRGAEGILMGIYPDGSFFGEWTRTYNTLFRVGRRFPRGTSIESVGEISMAYDVSEFRTSRGATYLGVYGWTRGPLIEWYIVENWIDWTVMNAVGEGNTVHHGTLTANGHTYDIVTSWRINQPSIEGAGMTTFMQIFSIRQDSRRQRNQTTPLSGTIDISAHFAAWEAEIAPQTITVGGTTHTAQFDANAELHEIMFVVEGFGGSELSSGAGRVDALCMRYGDNVICTADGCANCTDMPAVEPEAEQGETPPERINAEPRPVPEPGEDFPEIPGGVFVPDEPSTHIDCYDECCDHDHHSYLWGPIMRLEIGSNTAERLTSAGSTPIPLEAPPFIDPLFERTMVPVRVIAEFLGATVTWEQATQTVTIANGGSAAQITIGEELPGGMGTAVIIEDRTFVPVRYVSDVLGAPVRWDGDAQAVFIG